MKFANVAVAALILSFCSVLSAHPDTKNEVRDKSTGEAFPSEISITHNGKEYQLQCTGVATRKKFFVKIYSVASYLQKDAQGGDKFQLFTQDDYAKQLTLKWVHEASAEKVTEGYVESLKSAFSESEYAQLKSAIDTYIEFFNRDVKKGDEQVIRWLPGGYIEVIINGKQVGNLTNKAFAKGLWSVWFGAKSVVDRNGLVSYMK